MSILKALKEKVLDINLKLDKPLTEEARVDLQVKLNTIATDLGAIDDVLEGKDEG